MPGGRLVQCSNSGQTGGSNLSPVASSGLMLGLRVPGSVESGTVSFGLILLRNSSNYMSCLWCFGGLFTGSRIGCQGALSALKVDIGQGDTHGLLMSTAKKA